MTAVLPRPKLHSDGQGAHAGIVPESPAPTWTMIDKGSFVIGHCEVCGWTSPARRAYATVEREGIKHAAVCAGPPEPVSAPDAGEATSA